MEYKVYRNPIIQSDGTYKDFFHIARPLRKGEEWNGKPFVRLDGIWDTREAAQSAADAMQAALE